MSVGEAGPQFKGKVPAETNISRFLSHNSLLCRPDPLTLPLLPLPLLIQITSTNVDIARVSPAYHLYTQAEVEEVMARI